MNFKNTNKRNNRKANKMKKRNNILCINWKGGAGKTTSASVTASNLPSATLIEIDKINKSDSKILSKDYKSIQLEFLNESDENFINFEDILRDDGFKIIDVGAVKLEIFHKAMTASNLYPLLDLIIITSMDGKDDFAVAMSYLQTIKKEITPEKLLFSFNRFNEYEYPRIEEQFTSFFNKKVEILNSFGIDLNDEDNYYVLKDSRAVKQARERNITLKSLVKENIEEIEKKREEAQTRELKNSFTRYRSLVIQAQAFHDDYVIPMMQKIIKKLESQS